MVIDSSAIIAILLGEPDAEDFAKAIVSEGKRLLSSVSHLEISIVIEAKKGELGSREFDLLLHQSQIEIISFTAAHAKIARYILSGPRFALKPNFFLLNRFLQEI